MKQIDATTVEKLLKQGLNLEYLTLGWNIIGALVVIFAGLTSDSTALIGFGIDSRIEIFASIVVIWQLKGLNQAREKVSIRLLGTAFFALSLYVFGQLTFVLIKQSQPQQSIIGIMWLMVTLLMMLFLAWAKNQTGKKLNNKILLTEARVTLVDAYLAGTVLFGLILNSVFGWWFADPLAALFIVFYGIREGWHAWHDAAEYL